MTDPDRRMTLVLVVIAVAPLLALASTAQAAIWLDHGGARVPWNGLLRARLVDVYCYAAFLPLLFALARRFPIRADGWPVALAVHFAASLACAAAKESVFTVIGNWFRPGVFDLLAILAEDYAAEVFTFWALMVLVHLIRLHGARTAAAPETAFPAGDRFVVRDRAGTRLIPTGEVAWIDAQGNYARLHTTAGRYLVRETMASLERRLAPAFLRVHRGALVNVAHVAGLERGARGLPRLVLDGGERIAAGRVYAGAIRRLFA
jgi:LytTr DNA-binding domain